MIFQTYPLSHGSPNGLSPWLRQALAAAAEAQQLEELSDAALPKLYAQLYELRRAADASAWTALGGK